MAVKQKFKDEIGAMASHIAGYNDMHPAGGSQASRNAEGAMVQFWRELRGEDPIPEEDEYIKQTLGEID